MPPSITRLAGGQAKGAARSPPEQLVESVLVPDLGVFLNDVDPLIDQAHGRLAEHHDACSKLCAVTWAGRGHVLPGTHCMACALARGTINLGLPLCMATQGQLWHPYDALGV